jgi:multiple sugar transport system ATP-binding protein
VVSRSGEQLFRPPDGGTGRREILIRSGLGRIQLGVPSSVELRGVQKRFGTTDALESVSLRVEPGELAVFVGPSGCGKSTLLRLIAGLETPTAGTLHIGDRDITTLHPSRRGIAMVFQSYALYPHMSVAENMAFGLEIRGMKRDAARAKVAQAAEILQLTELLERKPRALSGGQRQRVAIGRAIVREPEVFLFDEPLSNLDAALRGQMRVELARLHARLGATMIYVTHDQVEAMTLANKIVVMNGGRVEQIGAPLELYNHPRNVFVAGFLGSPRMNLLPCGVKLASARDVLVTLPSGSVLVSRNGSGVQGGDRLTLGVRPEDFRVLNDPSTPRNVIEGRVVLAERLGGETLVHVTPAAAADDAVPIVVKLPGDVPVGTPGTKLRLAVDPTRCHLFDSTGAAIREAVASERVSA